MYVYIFVYICMHVCMYICIHVHILILLLYVCPHTQLLLWMCLRFYVVNKHVRENEGKPPMFYQVLVYEALSY